MKKDNHLTLSICLLLMATVTATFPHGALSKIKKMYTMSVRNCSSHDVTIYYEAHDGSRANYTKLPSNRYFQKFKCIKSSLLLKVCMIGFTYLHQGNNTGHSSQSSIKKRMRIYDDPSDGLVNISNDKKYCPTFEECTSFIKKRCSDSDSVINCKYYAKSTICANLGNKKNCEDSIESHCTSQTDHATSLQNCEQFIRDYCHSLQPQFMEVVNS